VTDSEGGKPEHLCSMSCYMPSSTVIIMLRMCVPCMRVQSIVQQNWSSNCSSCVWHCKYSGRDAQVTLQRVGRVWVFELGMHLVRCVHITVHGNWCALSNCCDTEVPRHSTKLSVLMLCSVCVCSAISAACAWCCMQSGVYGAGLQAVVLSSCALCHTVRNSDVVWCCQRCCCGCGCSVRM
jgi:hypothetical protein